ncbi:MAG: flagellar motor switch protein FliN [Spirochaetaceae bacterium]|jgi:flagellar motor switch protein FliN/FliY|nr:flagellar motor switch protein FliN [Spirochaetaceae bacterium]
MSDGALSQDEIDALLAGVDSSALGSSPSAPAATAAPAGSEDERKIIQAFLSGTVDAQSSNLSMMTGKDASFRGPNVVPMTRDDLLQQLPDMVTAVKADFNSGFPGEHSFLFSEDTAKAIASLMNKEENIQLDEMAMSVLGEVVSQLVGSQITTLTEKTGNKSISSVSPEAANVPKAVAALPGGTFMCATYQLILDDGKTHQLWEVLGPSVSSDIARALDSKSGGSAAAQSSFPGMDMGAMPNLGMGGGMPAPAMGGDLSAMGGGMAMQGTGGMMPMGAANVQSVQFPNLMPQATPQEQGNIGLIMDVYMEMTVELGRTRKLIKEILGMGEGTIIELDKLAGEPVDILVNHKLIAKGEVVVIDENFGVRVTEIVSPMERMGESI